LRHGDARDVAATEEDFPGVFDADDLVLREQFGQGRLAT
jgi:hypothetical protein